MRIDMKDKMKEIMEPELLKTINDNPSLISLLYDVGLMPEQIIYRLWPVLLAVVAYKMGRDA